MRVIIILFVFILFLFSCSKDNKEYVYYSNGKIKSVYEIQNNMRHGKYEEYTKDGNIKCRGQMFQNLPKGEFIFYSKRGKIKIKKSYVIVENESKLNEWIEYNKDDEIIHENSCYLDINKEFFKNKDSVNVKIELKSEQDSFIRIIYGAFSNDYNLVDSLNVDTLVSNNLQGRLTIHKNQIYNTKGILQSFRYSFNSEGEEQLIGRNIYFDLNKYYSQ